MREIRTSGSRRERSAAVIGLRTSHPVLSSLLYRFNCRFSDNRCAPRLFVNGVGLGFLNVCRVLARATQTDRVRGLSLRGDWSGLFRGRGHCQKPIELLMRTCKW